MKPSDPVYLRNRSLSQRLSRLVEERVRASSAEWERARPPDDAADLRVVITANEVNHMHGTGPLVQRICRGWTSVCSIRARNDFGGQQEFGDWQWCMRQRSRSRLGFFAQVLGALRGRRVETAVCVPFLRDEFLTAIAVQKSFGARLCAYIMDDQNVAGRNIPDDLMREFLECCSLRLATHPELRLAYERKFGLPFHLLPAVVPAGLIAQEAGEPAPGPRAALIGSFWEQRWFDGLCQALSPAKFQVDWFGNNQSPWVEFDPARMERAGIRAHGLVSEDRLAEALQTYPVVIVPAAPLDGAEMNPGVARLSLPGRILFTLAVSNTPVLVMGSAETCGARFVRHFGVGESAPYESRAVLAAMDRMSDPVEQARMRERAARLGPLLSDRGAGEWLAASIARGRAVDDRFESVFSDYPVAGVPQQGTAVWA